MPCVIRKIIDDKLYNLVELAGEEWRLREQVEALEFWLRSNPHALDPKKLDAVFPCCGKQVAEGSQRRPCGDKAYGMVGIVKACRSTCRRCPL